MSERLDVSSDPEYRSDLRSEYEQLRGEIRDNNGHSFQILAAEMALLAGLATLLAFSLSKPDYFASSLACSFSAWFTQRASSELIELSNGTLRLATYIKNRLERAPNGFQWETHLHALRHSSQQDKPKILSTSPRIPTLRGIAFFLIVINCVILGGDFADNGWRVPSVFSEIDIQVTVKRLLMFISLIFVSITLFRGRAQSTGDYDFLKKMKELEHSWYGVEPISPKANPSLPLSLTATPTPFTKEAAQE